MEGRLTRSSFSFVVLLLAVLCLHFVLGQMTAVPVEAASFIRYVDGAAGVDASACRRPAEPCKTIAYALKRAVDEDTVRVAQGTYIENLSVYQSVKIEGGYEAAGWTRDIAKYETIIDGTDGQYQVGDWDGRAVGRQVVIKDGEQYRMWYDGRDVIGLVRHVGAATSTDGKTWTKYNNNPVLSGDKGAWDEFGEHRPFVMKDNGLYRMWYEGSQDGDTQFGYATSADGITWTKYGGNPVLTNGPDAYDEYVAGSGSILLENGVYKLWYQAVGDQGGIIAYATSPDGLNWTKVGPALTLSDTGWDSSWLWGPSVVKLGETYWMWYSGNDSNGGCAIGAVTSSDGVTWTRFRDEPVLKDPDDGCTTSTSVIDDGGTLKMWYQNFAGDPWQGFLNYAESTDGVIWVKYAGNPVLSPGDLGQTGMPVINFDTAGKSAALDGFTIRNGFAPNGAGVNIWHSDVTVQNSKITTNRAVYSGGGINASELTNLMAANNEISLNQVDLNHGGGIAIDGQSKATINKNTLFDNSAGSGGGGIGAYEHKGLLAIVGNDLHGNDALWGGAVVVDSGDGDVIVSENDVYANEALDGHGGGIDVFDTEPSVVISSNRVYDNAGRYSGGIEVHNAGRDKVLIDSNDVRDNRVVENWAAGGIFLSSIESEALVVNNVVAGNDNEGIKGQNFSALKVINNTVVDNGRYGVEMFAWPSEPPDPFTVTLRNNIIVGHSECAVHGWNGAQFVAGYNDLWGNGNKGYCQSFNGSNISQNPRFVDRAAGNLRLMPSSPAVDAGSGQDAPPYDIDGSARPFGGGYDIGAYEWPPSRWMLPLILNP